ncbi:MAG: amidohydrolase family protein [Peptococcaceae bacterium]|nr:amidohydrolase family protein [Peptococcaceae bacterium]
MEIIRISPSGRVTVRAGRVFDGRSLIPGEGTDIVVSGGVIGEVRPSPPDPPPELSGAVKILDLREYTVLPGLVDCHVHLALDGDDFNKSLELWDHKDELAERIVADLERTLAAGIVAVRDGGDRESIGLEARDLAARGVVPGPRILASGAALRKKGRYGSFLGPGLPDGPPADAVEKMARRGVDQIKVLVSGVVSFKNYGRVGPVQFSEGELAGIVSAARRRGLKVMAHASSDEAVRMAVRAGADSLEHGYFISDQSLELLAGAGIPWVPTLAPVASQARGRHAARHSRQDREVIERTCQRQMRMVKKAAGMGIRIGAGTDAGAAGVRHGEGYMDEILLLEEAGLSREEILRAATSSGASILGLEKEMGMVGPGFRPYLIAVRGNPLDDLRHLANVAYMILPSAG